MAWRTVVREGGVAHVGGGGQGYGRGGWNMGDPARLLHEASTLRFIHSLSLVPLPSPSHPTSHPPLTSAHPLTPTAPHPVNLAPSLPCPSSPHPFTPLSFPSSLPRPVPWPCTTDIGRLCEGTGPALADGPLQGRSDIPSTYPPTIPSARARPILTMARQDRHAAAWPRSPKAAI